MKRDPESADRPTVADAPGPVVAPTGGDGDRYLPRGSLGRGGMGEVTLCLDRRIGRLVAIKRMLKEAATSPHVRLRFLHEAQVQGCLEHPSIVPVYDLTLGGDDGEPSFTMKHVRGRTLRSILDAVRAKEPAAAPFTSRRVLGAFASVCHAVAFAHSRDVVHRDLKPSNVMLGDFGEVYVLDWGIARTLHETVAEGESAPRLAGLDLTGHGALLGTVGYMPPEQLASSDVDARADVYALGAILFEILTLEPLHSGTTEERMQSTVLGTEEAKRSWAAERDVPPELEAVWRKATAIDPDDRYPTAGAMHEDLQRFLDDERDVALRHQMAERYALAASDLTTEVIASSAPALEARRRALRGAGRALALDPDNELAGETLMRLLRNPPLEAPAEVRGALDLAASGRIRSGLRLSAAGFTTLFAYLPLLLVMGARQGWAVASIFGTLAVLVVFSLALARWTARPNERTVLALLGATCVFLATTALVVGPFIVVPGFAAVVSIGFMLQLDRHRVWALALGGSAVLVPLALELFGVLSPSYAFDGNALLVLPRAVSLPPAATMCFLALSSLTTLVISAVLVMHMRRALAEAERRSAMQAWQLEQVFVRREASDAPPPPNDQQPS